MVIFLFVLFVWFGVPVLIASVIASSSDKTQDNQSSSATNDMDHSYYVEDCVGKISRSEASDDDKIEEIKKTDEGEFFEEVARALNSVPDSNDYLAVNTLNNEVIKSTCGKGTLPGESKSNGSESKRYADDAFDNAILASLNADNNTDHKAPLRANESYGGLRRKTDATTGFYQDNTRAKDSLIEETNLYKVYYVKQRTLRWFSLRKGKVTGSDAYYLKNNSVSKAIYHAQERQRRNYHNEAMERGIRLEPIGIEKFAKKYKKKVEKAGFIQSKRFEKAGFSPDGIIKDANGRIEAIVEHKAYGMGRHFECYNKVFAETIYQMQYGMFVSGAKEAYLVLYNPDIYDEKRQLLVKVMPRDSSIQKMFKDRFEEYEAGNGWLTSSSVRLPRTNEDMSFALA